MVKLEYIWLDGYTPEPNLRSKVKILPKEGTVTLSECPEWSFDGSSTKQAEGHYSDRILKPVALYTNCMDDGLYRSYFVLCEVYNPDGTVHESNIRHILPDNDNVWYGFEQEYTIVKDGRPIGFPKDGFPAPQGKYYCGVGSEQVNGRSFVDEHLEICLNTGLSITGTNAEVLLGQWEYQIFNTTSKSAADDLWLSRYILQRLSEKWGYRIEFHPKPVMGDWNGSGLHCNFSNHTMRNIGGMEYFDNLFNVFKNRHILHIENYGSSNEQRLTGKHETQSIHKFSWGVSDRGASLRVPIQTSLGWKGYVEDRRPASNADPYRIVKVISDALIEVENIKK
jgi:glutamine synthetase